jgi:hypothetical protein
LDGFVNGFQDDFRQEADGFAELGFIEKQSESGNLSVDLNFERPSEPVDPFFDLFFGVGLSASQSSMGNELGDRAVLQGLLSASDLDTDGDCSLISWPVFSGDSDAVSEFSESGGSG